MIDFQSLLDRGYEYSRHLIGSASKPLDGGRAAIFYDFRHREGGIVLFTDGSNEDFVELLFNFETVEQMDLVEQTFDRWVYPTAFGNTILRTLN